MPSKRKRFACDDLTKIVGADQSMVSKHLSVLKNANILEDRKESNKVFYHLRTPCVIEFFECAMEVIRSETSLLVIWSL